MSMLVCAQEGCENGLATGHALQRVSPKGPGQKFVGKCDEHFDGQMDPVALVIQQDNHDDTPSAKAVRDHAPGCKYRTAIVTPVGIECEHGYDVCPTCDPCTCR